MSTWSTTQRSKVWSARETWLLFVNAALFGAAFAACNHRLPSVVATHFNINDEPDGWMGKYTFWTVYACLTIVLPAALTFARAVDPRKEHYVRFETFFLISRWAVSLFLHGVCLTVVLRELGYSFPTSNIALGTFGALFAVLGNRMGQVKSNFFFGIRTPWSLADDDNWRRTHRLAAKVWFAAGVVMFALAWFVPQTWSIFALLAGVVFSGLVPCVYSYVLFARKER